MTPADNPFCRPADPAIYGDRLPYLCTVTASDRVAAVRDMDAYTLRRALAVPGLQATVRRAIEARLRKLDAPSIGRAHTTRMTDAIERNMGTRWCSSCCADRPADGGKWSLDKYGNRNRWRCAACLHRIKHKLPAKGFTI